MSQVLFLVLVLASLVLVLVLVLVNITAIPSLYDVASATLKLSNARAETDGRLPQQGVKQKIMKGKTKWKTVEREKRK